MRDISLPDLHGNEHVIVAERFGNAHTKDRGWESPEWEKEIVDCVELVNEDDFARFGEGVPLVEVWGRGKTIATLVFGDRLGETG